MTLIKRLMTGALLACAAVSAAHAAGLGVPKPDSVQGTAAAPLATSACPNLTDNWYAAPPAGYFLRTADNTCQPDSSCAYGVNVGRTACNTGTIPTVTLSVPGGVYTGSYFTATWSSNGVPMPTGVTITCYNSGWGVTGSWNLGGASGSANLGTYDSMVGPNNCRASATNAIGTGYSGFAPMTVSCPPGMVFNGSSCVAALAACPASISVWNGAATLPLAGTPGEALPNGHAWCLYYGNSGGDWWYGAFDRVVGAAVGFLPTYTDNGSGYSFSWTPQYGSATNTPYGGKCVNDFNKSGYWQAWTQNDCGTLNAPIALWNFRADNPLAAALGMQYIGRGTFMTAGSIRTNGIPSTATCTNMTGWGCMGWDITYPGVCINSPQYPEQYLNWSTGVYTALGQQYCRVQR